MKGYAYDFLNILHAVTVIFTMLWLPFGKFFHIFQRGLQLGVGFYKDVGRQGEQACCRRCGEAFASRMHVEDLITVEKQLGYEYEMPGTTAEHYQWICPRCRRVLLGLAQGMSWRVEHQLSSNNLDGNSQTADEAMAHGCTNLFDARQAD
jgi:hypothetical protein